MMIFLIISCNVTFLLFLQKKVAFYAITFATTSKVQQISSSQTITADKEIIKL